MNSKFKNSLIVLVVISIVVIIKIPMKASVRENELKELDSTYTPSNNFYSLNNLPASSETTSLSEVPVATEVPEKASRDINSIVFESEVLKDGINTSRKETETWILNKLNTYNLETETISNNSFSFEDGFLVHEFDSYVRPTTTNNSKGNAHRRFSIPINDISKIEKEYSLLKISTNNRTIKKYFFEKSREELDNEAVILFNLDREPDIADRLRKAFFYLKTFYKKSNYKKEPF
ncbi:MAG: hypothetical protein Q7T12_00500 [Flavobacterium sp.]|nr:hypothetical protein [Flavobacterium sp.]